MQDPYTQKLIAFRDSHKRMPSYAEMAKLFGFKSKNAVAKVVDKLIDAGFVAKDALGKLIPGSAFSALPLLGSVKAGFPADVSEVSDSLDIEHYLVKRRDNTYLLEVDGESMKDAHITDGDIVIAERTSTAKAGDIVIANVDGEFTMKYLRYDTKGNAWLEPANKTFKPIYPKHSFEIVAIIKGVMRKY